MSLPYMVVAWRWPDVDDVDLDEFPLELIGVAKDLQYAFDIAYDDIRKTADMDDVDFESSLNAGNIKIEPKIDSYGKYSYHVTIPEFRWVWVIRKARMTFGI